MLQVFSHLGVIGRVLSGCDVNSVEQGLAVWLFGGERRARDKAPPSRRMKECQLHAMDDSDVSSARKV